ncbi:CGNR zinc finger domain-containing protein [Mesorhizobium sp. ZC-5]|uniref:CGNR zinc finger domain-containing protein n=1 Tax=Mesorhizobium sp. ZC-5 TaxID=2986066 RepID=UPI0021E826FC|nr:ABATE domain-containing protein [Mesorhizobium sp. ZC-5]MCV3239323.1 ABATE domain-containing protein [Mesorhizobium sp. ZC-5]
MTVSRHQAVTTVIVAPPEGLCLDFVNTRYWRGSPVPTDELTSFPPLLGWLKAKSGVDETLLKSADAQSKTEPAKAEDLLSEAISLREALHRLFAAAATDRPLLAADFIVVNSALAEAPPRRKLASADGGWEVSWSSVSMPALLASVLWSAADLLLARNDRRIRQCANEKCRFLFIDESKNGTRRWCDMSSCGNRAKARRHLLKKKQA